MPLPVVRRVRSLLAGWCPRYSFLNGPARIGLLVLESGRDRRLGGLLEGAQRDGAALVRGEARDQGNDARDGREAGVGAVHDLVHTVAGDEDLGADLHAAEVGVVALQQVG